MNIKSKIIKFFLEDLPSTLKSSLDSVITDMLESTKYMDGSTLIYDEDNMYGYEKEHYHNWECEPTEIEEIKHQ